MIIQPFSYFGQIITAPAGATIRPDTHASSVTIAIPGTQFGSTFGQTDYRSDISGYINGGTSLTNAEMPLTGTGQVTSATSNFTGYTTSMSRPNGTNYGAITGTTSNINFGANVNFTIEGWMRGTAGSDNSWMGNKYNAGWGFFGWSDAGYWRWVGQNAAFNENLGDYSGLNMDNDVWYHIFLCRSGSTWIGGVNGTIRASFTFTNAAAATGTSAPHQICSWAASTQRTTLFQDYRVTKGVARYTGSIGASYTLPQSIVIP